MSSRARWTSSTDRAGLAVGHGPGHAEQAGDPRQRHLGAARHVEGPGHEAVPVVGGFGEAEVVEDGDADEEVPGARGDPVVEGRLDADLDRRLELPPPRQGEPPHEAAQARRVVLVDGLHLARPVQSWSAGVVPDAATISALNTARRWEGSVAHLEQRPKHLDQVVTAEEEEGRRRSAEACGELTRVQPHCHARPPPASSRSHAPAGSSTARRRQCTARRQAARRSWSSTGPAPPGRTLVRPERRAARRRTPASSRASGSERRRGRARRRACSWRSATRRAPSPRARRCPQRPPRCAPRRARTRQRTPPARRTAAARRARAAGTTTRWSTGGSSAAPRRVRRPPSQHRRAILERGEDLAHAERRGAGGGELDGQGQAIEARAELLDRRRRHAVEVGAGRGGPLAEELDPVVAGSSGRTATTCSPSMPSASRLVTRTAASGHAAVEHVEHVRRAVDHVLAVVDDEQDGPGRSTPARPSSRSPAARRRRAARWRRARRPGRSGRRAGRTGRGRSDGERGGDVDGQSCLAHPADAGQRHDALLLEQRTIAVRVVVRDRPVVSGATAGR